MIESFKTFINPAKYEPSKENIEICAQCAKEGPVCCQCLPCHISPHDLKDISFQGIIDLIETGLVSIDWWDGGDKDFPYPELMEKKPYYFLRMRAKNKPVIDPAFSLNVCKLWDRHTGCPLEFSYRPKGARELIPARGSQCYDGYTKPECAIEWIPFEDILKQVYDHYAKNENLNELSWFFDNLFAELDNLKEIMDIAYENDDSSGIH